MLFDPDLCYCRRICGQHVLEGTAMMVTSAKFQLAVVVLLVSTMLTCSIQAVTKPSDDWKVVSATEVNGTVHIFLRDWRSPDIPRVDREASDILGLIVLVWLDRMKPDACQRQQLSVRGRGDWRTQYAADKRARQQPCRKPYPGNDVLPCHQVQQASALPHRPPPNHRANHATVLLCKSSRSAAFTSACPSPGYTTKSAGTPSACIAV